MNNCAEIQAALSAYIDNELTSLARGKIQQHLEQCEDCRQHLSELNRLATAFKALPKLTPAPGFLADVRRKIAGANTTAKHWTDHTSRVLWWKISLETLAAVGIFLLVIRFAHFPVGKPAAENTATSAKPASGAVAVSDAKSRLAGNEQMASSVEKLAPKRLIGGTRAPVVESELKAKSNRISDALVIRAKDFAVAEQQVQEIARAVSGQILPRRVSPGKSNGFTEVLHVELPVENLDLFKSRLESARLLSAADAGQPATAAAQSEAGRLGMAGGRIVVRIQVLPPAD